MPHSPLLLQLVIILVTARLCGLLLRYAGQPTVVGEMAAGIVLGPIVFGALFPDFHAQLFAPESLAGLSSLSMLGLVLFMFIVGAELRAPAARIPASMAMAWMNCYPTATKLRVRSLPSGMPTRRDAAPGERCRILSLTAWIVF